MTRQDKDPLRVAVFVSGRGSNLQALIDATQKGQSSARLAAVLSNRDGVYALERAQRAGIPARVFLRRDYASRAEQQAAMLAYLRQVGAELMVLAGFDQIVEPSLVRALEGRVINIHPSLLPSFGGGLHGQADALAYGVKVSGCTVHFVTEGVDTGPIIMQAPVPVLEDDTVETLSARILEQEHRILPAAVELYAEGRLRIEGRRVRILPPAGKSD
ncbi:MAG: phosphoribosylglycinamide formyltransferase [Chloroflexi bacterium]|nr:phosphoribosylglycinamide formyltransferase [Chloroflexota bacterium]